MGKLFRKKKSISAFTLAEVLITLMIIGVVAAITIPAMYTSWQKHTYVVGLKKMYATLQEGVKQAYVMNNCNFGDPQCFDWTSRKVTQVDDHHSFSTNSMYILQKVFVNSVLCPNGTDDTACNNLSNPFSTVNYWTAVNAQNPIPSKSYFSAPILLLQDGTYLIFANTLGGEELFADVNGSKGPNIVGRDIFAFSIAKNNYNCEKYSTNVPAGTILPHGSLLRSAVSCGQSIDYTYWKTKDFCTTDTINNPGVYNAQTTYKPSFCTGRVLEENAMNY